MPFWPSVMTVPAGAPTRHPMDPEPTGSSKARAVFALGLAALITVALVLARQTHRQLYASGGYLTGSAWIRRGRRLAWAGIILALTALVVASIAGLLHVAGTPGQDFDTDTD
jgi:hydroxylaminobenzene mutase